MNAKTQVQGIVLFQNPHQSHLIKFTIHLPVLGAK